MRTTEKVAGATGEFRDMGIPKAVARPCRYANGETDLARRRYVRMHRNIKSRVALAVSVAGLAVSLSAGAVFAGEVTGNGKTLEPLHANSICAYSGLNDKVVGEGDLTSRVQSWGQIVRGAAKAGVHGLGGAPGHACRGGSL